MKLLPPTRHATELLSLIAEAERTMTIVSPTARLSGRSNLASQLKAAKDRGVRIFWYHDADKEVGRTLRQIGIEAVAVEHLRCRLYFNDRQALLTSLSPQQQLATDAVSLGYLTGSASEFSEVTTFVTEYILPAALPAKATAPMTIVSPPPPATAGLSGRVNTLVHERIRARIKSGELAEELVTFSLRGAIIEDYYPGIALVIDVGRRYDRLVLQPRGSKSIRTATFGYLGYYLPVLGQSLGAEWTLGHRMKRMHCRLPNGERQFVGKPQALSSAYVDRMDHALEIAFGPLRDELQSLMAPAYCLVG